ncbi:MAG: EFR1 family ferrodoxin [Spirochaetales bacterium]|nr:EFR1 family ferrodoxin [Spirochaetales bacterium]
MIHIYYFSGTGNSLFIARKLNESLANSKLIPILNILKNPQNKVDVEKVIFVFPVYALTIPLPVRDFLASSDFSSVQYFAAVATRLGLYFNDFKRIDKLLKTNKLNSYFLLNMGSNDVKIKNYSCPSEEKIQALEILNLSEISRIIKIIINSENSREIDSTYLEPEC